MIKGTIGMHLNLYRIRVSFNMLLQFSNMCEIPIKALWTANLSSILPLIRY